MHIDVLGPGAIGTLFAARLARSGSDVRLVDKDAERAARIDAEPVTVTGSNGEFRHPVPCAPLSRVTAAADLVCLCVKAYDTAEAVRAAARLIGPETVVVSLQNGLDNAETLLKHVGGGDRIVCAVTDQGALLTAPGHVSDTGRGATRIAPFVPEGMPGADGFARLLQSAGLPARTYARADTICWSKAIVNTAINPVTAIWNLHNGDLPLTQSAAGQARAACREAQAIARAAGIPLLYRDAWAEVCRVCEQTAENRSSMLQDIRAGRRTEIDAITGAIVRKGDTVGIEAPVCRELWERVRDMESALDP